MPWTESSSVGRDAPLRDIPQKSAPGKLGERSSRFSHLRYSGGKSGAGRGWAEPAALGLIPKGNLGCGRERGGKGHGKGN